MIKNDYRRSLIMLRPHAPGFSGHVRLERRTLMGSMYFVINVPSGSGVLCAALVRRGARGVYTAVKIGELRRDGRGQASLAWTFDPRNIDGRELEEYRLITVVLRQPNGRCDVVLSGNVNGSVEVSWDAVRAASCSACSLREPACEDCAPNRPASPGEGPLGPQTPTVDAPAVPGEGPLGSQTPTVDAPAVPGEGPLGSQTPSVDTPAVPEEGPLGGQTPTVDAPAVPGEGPLGDQTPSVDVPDEGMPDNQSPSVGVTDIIEEIAPEDLFLPENAFDGMTPPADSSSDEAEMFSRTREEPAAADVLGIDASVPWPGVSEQLRSIFTNRPVRELMLNDGYTYVSAPMPEGSGYERAEIGVKAKNGVPVSVSYALPSRYSPEPPPGLEDYLWKGGASEGWWTIETDAATGEKLK